MWSAARLCSPTATASEQAQVARIRAGTTLREQLQFDVYMRERDKDPTLTLGEHMKRLGRHF
jgi:4-hydroxy-4-methyl-2-oxoglutarate aldolase